MSVFVETVLSLDELAELKVANETKTPQGGGSFSAVQLKAEKKAIQNRYPTRPGLFAANKIAAREVARARHDKSIVKAERRIVLRKIRNTFNISLKVFDDAVARIDFELSELKKSQGKPADDDEDQQPKRKKAKVEKPAKAEKPRKHRVSKRSRNGKTKQPDRARRSPAKYREAREESEESGSSSSESDDEGDEDEGDRDSVGSVCEKLKELPLQQYL